MSTKRKGKPVDKNNEKDEKDLNYSSLIDYIKLNMGKCYYKKIVKIITSNEELYPNHIGLQLFKIRAMVKIIQRKYNKYEFNLEANLSHINKWLEMLLSCLLDLITLIASKSYDLNQLNPFHKESIIKYILTYLSLKASLFQVSDNISQVTALLAISLELINNYLPYSSSSWSYVIMQRILMMISNLHIKNNDYKKAASYLHKAYKIGIQIILYETVSKENLAHLTIKHTSYHIQHTIDNLVMIMILKGICHEHLGKLKNALKWYNLSYWIAVKLSINNQEFFMILTQKLYGRSMEYIDVLKELKDEAELINERRKLLLLQKKAISESDKKMSRIASGNYIDYQRMERSEKQLEKYIIPKDHFSPVNNSKKHYLSNVNLIDAYLSDDFKSFLNKSKQLNIADIDYKTKTQIETLLNNAKKPKPSSKRKFLCQTLFSSPLNIDYMSSFRKKPKINIITATPTLNRYDSSIGNKSSLSNEHKKPLVFEYTSSYKKKRMYLEELNCKELQFQKTLLKIKRGNCFRGDTLDKYDTIKEANFCFQRIIFENEHMSNLHGKKFKPYISLEQMKKLKNFMALENRILKSLNPAELQKYMCEKKKQTHRSTSEKNHNEASLVKSASAIITTTSQLKNSSSQSLITRKQNTIALTPSKQIEKRNNIILKRPPTIELEV